MVVTVIVTGVPRLMSLKDLAFEFNEVLDDLDIGDFRIRDVDTYSTNSSKRQVALDFESSFDAMTVQEKLDGFDFVTSGGSSNNIKAKIWTASEEPETSSECVISTTSRRDYYEQSVEDVNESLNMHIDLIKKQTLALKAQRKLLREQKKLKKEYTKLDTDSDAETRSPRKKKKRKRNRLKSRDSSGSVDRPNSRDKHSSPKSFNRRKRSRSRSCDDYLAIEYKKIATTRRSKSPEARKRRRSVARSKSREKPPRKSDPYKRRSRSRSCEKHSAREYQRSKNDRTSYSPRRQSSPRRIVRSKSRERHQSPRRISESYQRRSRSRTREKCYSVETIKYKKALLTISPKSKRKYERTEHCVLTSKSSKLRRSPSPFKGDLRSKIDSHKRKISRSRSRSRSPFKRKLMLTDSSSKSYKNRSPSTEKRPLSPYGKPRSKYYNESSSKPEMNSSKMLDVKRKTSKATEERESPDQEDLIELNAEIQSKRRQAMEDVLFEMELIQRKERKSIISNADHTFLTNLVKGIVKSRFQKLEVHNSMLVSDIVTHYRSHYSKEDDRALLRNLAEECKSLDEVTSTVVADSTAEVPDQQSQNDEIWTAVDEVLDGVDLDLLQAEPENNEVEENEDPEKKSQISEQEKTVVNSKNAVVPNDFEDTQINSTSEVVVTKININCVVDEPKQAKCVIMANKAINLVDLTSDIDNTNDNITSSGLPITNSDSKDTKKNAIEDAITAPKEFNIKNIKIVNVIEVKKGLIELSDDSDNEIDNFKHMNVTSTENQGPVEKSSCTGHIIEVESLVEEGKPSAQNCFSNPVKKVWTVDLTEDTDETELNLKSIKKEKAESDIIDSTTNPHHCGINNAKSDDTLSHPNLFNYIKQENIEIDSIILSDDDDIGTNNYQCNNSTCDQNVVKSIKKEQVATDEDKNNDKSGFSKSIILNSIKQEPGTAETDRTHNSDKPEINVSPPQNTIFNINILRAIKKEHETTVTEDLTRCAAESEINKDMPNTTIPLKIIPHFIKQENDGIVNDSLNQCDITNNEINMPRTINSSDIKQEYLVTDDNSTSQSEVNDNNNEQIMMPVPIVVSSVKQENKTTLNSAARIQSDVKDIIKEQIDMPRPLKSSDIKQEDVATNNDSTNQIELNNINNELITMPFPNIQTTIKHEDIETAISDAKSQCNAKYIDNDNLTMPVPIIEISIRKENKATVKNVPREEHIERKKEQSSLKQNTKIDGSTKCKEDGNKKEKRKKKKHKKETEGSIKNREEKESCTRTEEKNSTMKQKEKPCSTNLKEIKTNTYVSKMSQHEISKQSELKELSNKTVENEPNNVEEQNSEIKTRFVPKNPQFIVPTHIIMRQFKSLIKNEFNEHKYMYNITQKVLRDRFLELVKDKDYLKARDIVKMYRDRYKEKYEDFLGGIAADIKSGKYDSEIRKIAIQERENQKQTTSKKK